MVVRAYKSACFYIVTGNREPKEAGEKEFPRQKEVKEGSNLDLAQKARRFMIYVHSKLLICDDEVNIHLYLHRIYRLYVMKSWHKLTNVKLRQASHKALVIFMLWSHKDLVRLRVWNIGKYQEIAMEDKSINSGISSSQDICYSSQLAAMGI